MLGGADLVDLERLVAVERDGIPGNVEMGVDEERHFIDCGLRIADFETRRHRGHGEGTFRVA